MRAFVAMVCLMCAAPALRAQDWPHWRGPYSTGAATVSSAPERWSESDGVKWRTEIEGHGNSSPVVVGGRVYVTTALAAPQRTPIRRACDVLIGLLAILGMPAVLWCRWRQHKTSVEPPSRLGLGHRAAHMLDLTLCLLLGSTVIGFATLLVLGPNAVDRGLTIVRDAGVLLVRYLGRQQTNLSFIDWDEGNRHRTWIICSAVSLASLALGAFLFPARSVMRLLSAVALSAGVALAAAFVPWAAAYGARFPTGALVVFYSPVIAVATWLLLTFLAARWRTEGGFATGMATRTAACVPALLGLALFVSPNYLYEREMVTRRLLCLELASGKVVWRTDVFATPPETKSALNSGATPTPTVVGNTVVTAFGPGIAAVDIDGKVLWSRLFPHWIENSIYGAGSSPVTDGSAVYFTIDGEYEAEEQSRVIAHAARTGEELWIKAPGFARDGYATPIIIDDGAQKLLVAITSKTLASYATANGTLAWRLKVPVQHQPIPSPIAENGKLYVTGGISAGYTAAYRLRQGEAPEELWSTTQRADVSSPVLYRGRLYTISTLGIMVSYDADTGRVVWKKRVGAGTGGFYASLVAADGKIYASRSNGTTYVIAAEDEFRLISASVLPEEMFASPAITEECLLLRTAAALYCIGDTLRPPMTSGG